MASLGEISDGIERNTAAIASFDRKNQAQLEKGRVWRRASSTLQADKRKKNGPVLRTTVKPVKRFRPDSNAADGNNPSPSRKKRIKYHVRDNVAAPGRITSEESSRTESRNTNVSLPALDYSGLTDPNEDRKSIYDKESKVHHNSQLDPTDGTTVKKKRVWELWSVEDKNYFFDAVAMYGKDFEAIRTAIAHKHRKKGEVCLAKTKDQVRHLYYRTWTMISKIIDPEGYPDNINKAFQELYAVINYGEIRKRLGGNLKKKSIEKLNELIRDGTTSMRVKGKNFRIKTPSCKALKKMDPNYQAKEGANNLPLVSDTRRMKIPVYVTLELFPSTMASWNQVHSVAHNPRLRLKLSVQCQLSTIFNYLEKKWKPLSAKLYRVGEECQIRPTKSEYPKSTGPSIWDGTMVIRTPPDASVNNRIMVFQVANNKTHCTVSYALRKSSQVREKLPKCAIAIPEDDSKPTEDNQDESNLQQETNDVLSESEIVDSCASSEEDFDYDSANEGVCKDCTGDSENLAENNSSSLDCELPSQEKDEATERVNSLSTTFSVNDLAACVPSVEMLNEDGVLNDACEDEEECEEPNPLEASDIALTENDIAKITEDELPVNVERTENTSDPSLDQVKQSKKKSREMSETDDSHHENPDISRTSQADCDMDMSFEKTDPAADEKTLRNSDCSSCHTDSSNDHCDFMEAAKAEKSAKPEIVGLNDGSGSLDESNTVEDESSKLRNAGGLNENGDCNTEHSTKKLVLSTNLFGKADSKTKRRASRRLRGVKTIQSWTAKDCKKTTLAEIYIMLGKPSLFRLCYHWQHTASEKKCSNERLAACFSNAGKTASGKPDSPLSTGLLALIQAAKLTRLARETGSAAAKISVASQSKEKPPSPKPVVKPPKMKQASVQCEILKPGPKVDEKSSSKSQNSAPTIPPMVSNPHGRGVSKIIPVETVLVKSVPELTAFAVPAGPVSRHRRIAANPAKPMQATKVSAETIAWLLQRERTRNNRQVRKPIMERGSKNKPIQSAYRHMKTFSIVTCGPNKVGFLPKFVVSSRPLLAKTSTQTTSRPVLSSTITPTSSASINDLLDIETSIPSLDNIYASDCSNLLAQAAKQAGVAPPTPGKVNDDCKEDEAMTSSSDVAVTSSSDVIMTSSSDVTMTSLSDVTMTSSSDAVVESIVTESGTSGEVLISDDIASNDILKDAFGVKDTIIPTTSITCNHGLLPSSAIHPSSSSCPANTPLPPILEASHSGIDSLLEFSWSGSELLPSTFPVINDSLVEKLVHGDSDIVLSSVTGKQGEKRNLVCGSPLIIVDENSSQSKSLAFPSENFDLRATPNKVMPVHPWTINTNSRESIGLSGLLNTPNKVLSSDTEDSLDGLLIKTSISTISSGSSGISSSVFTSIDSKKSPNSLDSKLRQDQNSTSDFLAETGPEVDIQLQCMMNENSVDYISKFQDLVRQTTECEELPDMGADENARDGHQSPTQLGCLVHHEDHNK